SIEQRRIQGVALSHRDEQGKRSLALARPRESRQAGFEAGDRRRDAARRASHGGIGTGTKIAGSDSTIAGESKTGADAEILQQPEVCGDRGNARVPIKYCTRAN